MSLQQRHSPPADETDLEITAELPILDVMAYEADASNAAATAAEDSSRHSASNRAQDRDSLNDTWALPALPTRPSRSQSSPETANAVADENHARLEVNLQALSTTLRDVEERLTRKGERLTEIERALASAVTERDATAQLARELGETVNRAEVNASAAQAQIADLQHTLRQREEAEEARKARDADVHARLMERNTRLDAQLAENDTRFQAELAQSKSEFESRIASSKAELESRLAENQSRMQAQIDTSQREFEAKLTAGARALAQVERELADTRARAAGYLETLQSNEGRRSVFEDLISTLSGDVDHRDARIADLEMRVAQHLDRVRELEGQLRDRIAQIEALDKQVSALSAALAQRTEQHTDVEQARDSLQQAVHSLNSTVAERGDRIRVLEEQLAQLALQVSQQRSDLEREASERGQIVATAASLEAALKAATSRGDERDAAARAAQARQEELEANLTTQSHRADRLQVEVESVRAELQSSSATVQAAATERNEHTARIAAAEARILELEARVTEQQESVRTMQAESNLSLARAKELEEQMRAAAQTTERAQDEAQRKSARVEELEKLNQEWRAALDEARHAIADRDSLIQRLEQETAHSAVLVGHIQRSITRLDHGMEPSQPAPDGATRLLIRTDGESEVVHVLGRKTTLGRTPDNDLQIDAKFISRHHAVILAGPAHSIIEDLNSTNGVTVNGRRITRQPLKDGDTVMIGKTQFRFAVRPAR